MTTRQRELRAIEEEVREGPDRSRLFWWMVRHHASLAKDEKDGRMPWQRLCRRFAKKKLTDGNGQLPTPRRAAKTWKEACEEVQRLAAVQPAVLGHRSRPAGSYRPPATDDTRPRPPHAAIPSAPALAARPIGAAAKPFGPDPSIEEQLAEARRQFAANDRKRFGSM